MIGITQPTRLKNKKWAAHIRLYWLAIIAFAPVLIFALINGLFPLPIEKLYPAASTIVLDRTTHILRAFLASDDMWRIRVSTDEVSPTLKKL